MLVYLDQKENNTVTPITRVNTNEKKIGILIFLSSLVFVYLIYVYFDKWGTITSHIDNLTTAIFFVGMWLMAKRKMKIGFFGLLQI